MDSKKALEILKTAILLEKRGKTFYEKVAGVTENEDIRNIFIAMAEEEQKHIEYLSEQFKSCNKNGHFTKNMLLEADADTSVATMVLSKDLRDKVSSAGFEAAAISAAIELETKSIDVYSKRAEETTDSHEKEFYQWLADWEKTHHRLLNDLNKELTEKIWFDNKFWPF